jgi:hypothetical protein
MASNPEFDVSKAHRYFSAECFNKAWELIEKADRTPEEDEQMIGLSQASIWHWTQRDDCKNTNLSIGYWQAARTYAIVGRADEARRYARLCLDYSRQEAPFLLGYAYEALARAEKTAGDAAAARTYTAEAARLAETVSDAEDRKLLMNDLKTLE